MVFRTASVSKQPQTSVPLSARTRAPGTRIGYDPLLIRRLQSDHQRMLAAFTDIQYLLSARDYDGVKRKLGELRVFLQDHLMITNVKLYVYLARHLASDPAKNALVNEHRREMLANSQLIMDFLRTYSAARLDDSFAGIFQAEFLAIGSTLFQRIEREETGLYPLYKASYP